MTEKQRTKKVNGGGLCEYTTPEEGRWPTVSKRGKTGLGKDGRKLTEKRGKKAKDNPANESQGGEEIEINDEQRGGVKKWGAWGTKERGVGNIVDEGTFWVNRRRKGKWRTAIRASANPGGCIGKKGKTKSESGAMARGSWQKKRNLGEPP